MAESEGWYGSAMTRFIGAVYPTSYWQISPAPLPLHPENESYPLYRMFFNPDNTSLKANYGKSW